MEFLGNNISQHIIKVIGVGGGGSNAVNHMFLQGITGVDFIVCNTDNQALNTSPVPEKIQLGPVLTDGRGAGNQPERGRDACIESATEIERILSNNTKMLFITAGMGGGTGTGAAPVIAEIARRLDILTVGIVTIPFTFEGPKRIEQAKKGIEEMKAHVDSLIVITNDRLREIFGDAGIRKAFNNADDILATGAKAIAEIITKPGYINVDFADVNTVMRGSGVAIMGVGVAEGPDRAKVAVDMALNSPLLEENNIYGARQILLNITSGDNEVTMDEITEITDFVKQEAGFDANLIWGNCFDDTLGEKIAITIIATGFKPDHAKPKESKIDKIVIDIEGLGTTLRPSGLKDITGDDYAVTAEPAVAKVPGKEVEIFIEETIKPVPKVTAAPRQTQMPKLTYPSVIQELENEPAYKRRGVLLSNDVSSSDEEISRVTVAPAGTGDLFSSIPFVNKMKDMD